VPTPKAGAGSPSGAAGDLTVVLHLSDLHICQHLHLATNWRRVRDLSLFVNLLAARLAPDAVILSGDLVDAKSDDGYYQRQYPWEWEVYSNMTSRLKDAVGPQCQVRTLLVAPAPPVPPPPWPVCPGAAQQVQHM
jgi:Calcineurin-like phosphoesterase